MAVLPTTIPRKAATGIRAQTSILRPRKPLNFRTQSLELSKMLRILDDLNPLEVILVEEDMSKKGITSYTMTLGNDCIWVYYGPMNLYYIFKEGRIHDIQID
jgi:nitrogenase molybdenum-iron protein alpha/beta subunit